MHRSFAQNAQFSIESLLVTSFLFALVWSVFRAGLDQSSLYYYYYTLNGNDFINLNDWQFLDQISSHHPQTRMVRVAPTDTCQNVFAGSGEQDEAPQDVIVTIDCGGQVRLSSADKCVRCSHDSLPHFVHPFLMLCRSFEPTWEHSAGFQRRGCGGWRHQAATWKRQDTRS